MTSTVVCTARWRPIRVAITPQEAAAAAAALLAIVLHQPGLAYAASNPTTTRALEQQFAGMSRDEAMKVLMSTYRDQLERVTKTVKSRAPMQYLPRIAGAKVVYTVEETPFAFYYDAVDSNAIHICLGGINALDISASALGLSLYALKDQGWWFNFMLFSRAQRKRPNTVWLDPLHSAGFTPETAPRELISKAALSAHLALEDMLAFVVAHEMAHVALEHSGEQTATEDPGDYTKRLQKQELAADAFALDIVAGMDVNPLAVVLGVLTHLIVFEDPNSSDISKHPSDPQRIARIVEFFSRVSKGNDSAMLESARAIATLFSTPNAYDELDKLANAVSAESLRVIGR
jgi:hypothetical protein